MEFSCIICGKTLKLESGQDEKDPAAMWGILNGLEIRIYGGYGSSEYDPISNNTYLKAAICDKCFAERKDRLHCLHEVYGVRRRTVASGIRRYDGTH